MLFVIEHTAPLCLLRLYGTKIMMWSVLVVKSTSLLKISGNISIRSINSNHVTIAIAPAPREIKIQILKSLSANFSSSLSRKWEINPPPLSQNCFYVIILCSLLRSSFITLKLSRRWRRCSIE